MTDIIIQVGVGTVATGIGTVVGLVSGKISRKATAKAIKPENYTTQEEFQKAFKMRSLRNNVIATVATTVIDAGIGAGAAYLITDIVPGMTGTEGSEGGEDTTSSGETVALI